MQMDIGVRISRWREARNMSRQELADHVGVTVAAVYQWEGTGEHKTSPSMTTLEKIVEAFETTMAEFYGAIPASKPKKAKAS